VKFILINDVFGDYKNSCKYVANEIEKQLNKKPNSTFILPTGSTPIGVYNELTKRNLDWSKATTYNLDEYLDCSIVEQTYRYFMDDMLFNHINIKRKNINFPTDGDTSYGLDVDLCLLGIGGNGHIAFNEPGSSFESETRIVDLTENTIQDNSRFFPTINDVPTQAVTMGLKPIMTSKRIIIMGKGEKKKDILLKALHGDVTEKVPASILQKHKNGEVIYCD
jgi:glucosamine-6-phosphate deaminase